MTFDQNVQFRMLRVRGASWRQTSGKYRPAAIPLLKPQSIRESSESQRISTPCPPQSSERSTSTSLESEVTAELPLWAATRFATNTWRRRGSHLSNVAICGYNLLVTSTGIRELKDNLSRYIRRIEAGERIAITTHGRVVAELVPPGAKTKGTPSRFDELVASSVIRPPLEAGDPTEGWPDIRLPAGTAAELIDADRGEA